MGTLLQSIRLTSINRIFGQSDLKLHFQMQNLPSKSRNRLLYEKKYNIVDEIYRDFYAFNIV